MTVKPHGGHYRTMITFWKAKGFRYQIHFLQSHIFVLILIAFPTVVRVQVDIFIYFSYPSIKQHNEFSWHNYYASVMTVFSFCEGKTFFYLFKAQSHKTRKHQNGFLAWLFPSLFCFLIVVGSGWVFRFGLVLWFCFMFCLLILFFVVFLWVRVCRCLCVFLVKWNNHYLKIMASPLLNHMIKPRARLYIRHNR